MRHFPLATFFISDSHQQTLLASDHCSRPSAWKSSSKSFYLMLSYLCWTGLNLIFSISNVTVSKAARWVCHHCDSWESLLTVKWVDFLCTLCICAGCSTCTCPERKCPTWARFEIKKFFLLISAYSWLGSSPSVRSVVQAIEKSRVA